MRTFIIAGYLTAIRISTECSGAWNFDAIDKPAFRNGCLRSSKCAKICVLKQLL